MDKILPTSARFYLADDARVERDGRSTLIALFPDDSISLAAPNVPLGERVAGPYFFEGFAILTVFNEALGPLTLSLRLTAPDGSVILEHQEAPLNAEKRGPATFSARFRPFSTPLMGKHKYQITVDGIPFSYEFEIKQSEAQ